MRRLMATNPSEFDPRKFFGATVTACAMYVSHVMKLLVLRVMLLKIKPTSLEAMYQRYVKGELNAKVN